MTEPIVQARGITRLFKDHRAVDELNLSVEAGELFGLVGPDGSGKTTTLRLLAGLLRLSEGDATIAGCDLRRESELIKPQIGYMAQDFSLYAELTVAENLQFFSEIYAVPADQIAGRAERLLTFAGLMEFKRRRASHLSGGMKKKLALACTLIHQPKILLLDEPTTGVDPVSRREFWEILAELNLEGTTIIVSTPYMDEADRCGKVGLMYAGRMVICDTPLAIRDQLPGDLIEIRPDDWRAARTLVAALPGIIQVQTYGETLHVIVDSSVERLPQLQEAMRSQGVGYRSMRPALPRMEQAFISLIDKLSEEAKAEDVLA